MDQELIGWLRQAYDAAWSECESKDYRSTAMGVQVTLTLPERLVENARKFGQATQRGSEIVLADTLERLLMMIEDSPDTVFQHPVSALSDAEVLELANMKMDIVQNQRLGELFAKGKSSGLSIAERHEMAALMMIYQTGQLRKSEALAEAVQRGLREPICK
ncbi:MAG: hypothetical protein ACREEM_34330 [Blastocatellia bacterium]